MPSAHFRGTYAREDARKYPRSTQHSDVCSAGFDIFFSFLLRRGIAFPPQSQDVLPRLLKSVHLLLGWGSVCTPTCAQMLPFLTCCRFFSLFSLFLFFSSCSLFPVPHESSRLPSHISDTTLVLTMSFCQTVSVDTTWC
jgi:hypothetical protein